MSDLVLAGFLSFVIMTTTSYLIGSPFSSNLSIVAFLKLSIHASEEAEKFKPPFLCDELYNNFKKRLYTKNNEHYSQWKDLGESETNYYFVDGKWLAYTNGIKSIDDNFQKTS